MDVELERNIVFSCPVVHMNAGMPMDIGGLRMDLLPALLPRTLPMSAVLPPADTNLILPTNHVNPAIIRMGYHITFRTILAATLQMDSVSLEHATIQHPTTSMDRET